MRMGDAEDRERSPLHERDGVGMFEDRLGQDPGPGARDRFKKEFRVRRSGSGGVLSKGPLVSLVYFVSDKTASSEGLLYTRYKRAFLMS